MEHRLEFLTIGIYLLFLLGIGRLFAHLNRDVSDYVRGGAKGSWWMVGMSGLMASLSAFTFTGNAGGFFQAGLSPIVIYLAVSAAGIVFVLFLAAWFRQTRALTLQDIVRERFGPEVEQLNAYQAVIMGPLFSAVQLYALAVFCGAVFGLPVVPTILVIGGVVILYSTSGGRWAVMATDFFQSLILFPLAILVAVLCLYKIGGIGAFFAHFSDPAVSQDYQFINEVGHWPEDRFSGWWMVAIFVSTFIGQISFVSAGRYLSVKDGREARKASLLFFVLGLLTIPLWFIPPMTARFLMADEVMGTALKEPATGAYALIARQVLPNGMVGVMMIAMFAATMSSMDSGLNGITGTVVRNMLPPLFRRFRWRPLEERNQMRWCRLITVCLGFLILVYAVLLAYQEEVELFDIFFVINAVIGLPLGLPFMFAVFLRKLPRWSYFSIAGAALIPSLWAYVDKQLYGTDWTVQDRILWIMVAGTLGALISRLCYRFTTAAYRNQVDEFFARMRRPIDFQSEVGEHCDEKQLKLMGWITLAGSAFLSLLLFLPNPWSGRLAIFSFVLFIALVGMLLLWAARRRTRDAT